MRWASTGVKDAQRPRGPVHRQRREPLRCANMYSTGLAEGDPRRGARRPLRRHPRHLQGPHGARRRAQRRRRLALAPESGNASATLKKLRTDHIDIYYMHEWDGTTPVDEKMAALETLIQQGKVRYIAAPTTPAGRCRNRWPRPMPPAAPLRHPADPLHARGPRSGNTSFCRSRWIRPRRAGLVAPHRGATDLKAPGADSPRAPRAPARRRAGPSRRSAT